MNYDYKHLTPLDGDILLDLICAIHVKTSIWVNYNDLTATSPGIMAKKGNHPQTIVFFSWWCTLSRPWGLWLSWSLQDCAQAQPAKDRHRPPLWNEECGCSDTWAVVVGERFEPETHDVEVIGWMAHPVRYDRDSDFYMGTGDSGFLCSRAGGPCVGWSLAPWSQHQGWYDLPHGFPDICSPSCWLHRMCWTWSLLPPLQRHFSGARDGTVHRSTWGWAHSHLKYCDLPSGKLT